jgi:8-oxo-dGTP pyrophosphatase MutT (NUDIX family)
MLQAAAAVASSLASAPVGLSVPQVNPFVCEIYPRPTSANELLKKYSATALKYPTKADGRPQTTAGVFEISNGYVLLAEESKEKGSYYSEFSGSGEIAGSGNCESLLATAMREYEEERGISLDKKAAPFHALCYQDKPVKPRETAMFFIIGQTLQKQDEMLAIAQNWAKVNGKLCEKKSFKWVNIRSLLEEVSVTANPKANLACNVIIWDDAKATRAVVNIGSFVVEYLVDEGFRRTLETVGEKSLQY